MNGPSPVIAEKVTWSWNTFFVIVTKFFQQIFNLCAILGLVAFIWIFVWAFANDNAYSVYVPSNGTIGLSQAACNNRIVMILTNNATPDTPSVRLPSCGSFATLTIVPGYGSGNADVPILQPSGTPVLTTASSGNQIRMRRNFVLQCNVTSGNWACVTAEDATPV